jgi:hypothetical protein
MVIGRKKGLVTILALAFLTVASVPQVALADRIFDGKPYVLNQSVETMVTFGDNSYLAQIEVKTDDPDTWDTEPLRRTTMTYFFPAQEVTLTIIDYRDTDGLIDIYTIDAPGYHYRFESSNKADFFGIEQGQKLFDDGLASISDDKNNALERILGGSNQD